MDALRFAVIGINHDHVHGLMRCMLRAGAVCAGFHAVEDDLAAEFAQRYPGLPRIADRRAILEARDIALVVSAAIPGDRAALGIEVMRHGKDYLVDKPGALSLEELARVRAVQAETRRFYTIFYSEHLEQPSTVRAGQLVAEGAIGRVVNLVGLGPHRMRRPTRPDWFFDRRCNGAILTDIASHQCEQFLFFAGAEKAEVLSASAANRSVPDLPEFQDVGDIHLRAGDVTGYIRVDWFTPDALPVWGDGRLTILGTEGSIELRKYFDPAGRPGGNHLFLSNGDGVRYIDCSEVELPFGPLYLRDLRQRTQTAIGQQHVFQAMELALTAQAMADRAFISPSSQRDSRHGPA